MKNFIGIIFLLFVINIYSIENNTEITIFFTSDTNGHPLSFSNMGFDGQGGIPARATLIKNIIKDKKIGFNNYLILDTGGNLRGRPESNYYNGLTDIAGMDSIGYFASGVGSSELYNGAKNLLSLNKIAKFYYLCSNLKAINQKDPDICDKFIIKKIGNLKIGIFSVITQDALKEIPESSRKDFAISDPIDTANQIVKELRSDRNKVDIIIALTYLGYYPENFQSGSKNLASVVDGIDLIIDGRTGVKLDEPFTVNNSKIFQAYKWGLFLGEISLSISDKKIKDVKYALHPVNAKTAEGNFIDKQIPEDYITLSAIKFGMINYDYLQIKEIAKLDNGIKIDSKDSNKKETDFGNLICDAMIDYTKADISLQNAGGIGNGQIEGSVNRKSLDDIIKFDNSLMVVNLKGSDIIRILEYSMMSAGTGSFLQVGGVKLKYSNSQKKITEISINGKNLDSNTFYTVALNSWLTDGKDGYEILKDIPDKLNLNIIHREVIYLYIEKMKNIKPAIENRITFLD